MSSESPFFVLTPGQGAVVFSKEKKAISKAVELLTEVGLE